MEDIKTIIARALPRAEGVIENRVSAAAVRQALSDAGYVIVPKEPTKQMIASGNDEIDERVEMDGYPSTGYYCLIEATCARDAWQAMLTAWEEEQ